MFYVLLMRTASYIKTYSLVGENDAEYKKP